MKWLAALLLLIAGATASEAATIGIAQGRIAGRHEAGVDSYLAIPYAAPPLGPLRWRPPAPAPHWQGVRDATRYGPSCAQKEGLGVFAAPSDAEDCLTLNVFVPVGKHGPLPVMVWIPGGGLFSGSAADYDPTRLARDGGVVVVSLNYRVGILGFFAHPALEGEGHPLGNYGILDQQAALRWVRDNIRTFGGDPAQVTIFGQSSGGTSVMAQLVSPAAKGLFIRAIDQSGSGAARPIADYRDKAIAFARAVGCADQSAACLRSLSIPQILAIQKDYRADLMVDGTIVPERPVTAIAAGRFNRVPVISGMTQDEQTFALAINARDGDPMTAKRLPTWMAANYGAANIERLMAAYPLAGFATAGDASIPIAGDWRRCINERVYRGLAKWVPVYAYEFGDRTAPSYFPPTDFPMNAYHTAELQYLFPLFHGGLGTAHPLNAAQDRLAARMIASWSKFARTGSPDWPRFDPARDVVARIGGEGGDFGDYAAAHHCALWDEITR